MPAVQVLFTGRSLNLDLEQGEASLRKIRLARTEPLPTASIGAARRYADPVPRGCMSIARRAFAATLLAFAVTLAPARAQDVARPAHSADPAPRACLNQKERRALVESGAVMQLAAAWNAVRPHAQGTLVRARLCRRGDGFAYVLTVLGHDGKVTRVVVDAVKGTLVGER
jgi:hypothetical protein